MPKSDKLSGEAVMGTESRRAGTEWTDDRALARAMLRGDERAFDRFADAYVPALYRFASPRLGGNDDLVRDIVQSTLVKAIAKLGSFRGEAALMTWLCACCKTEIAAHFRRNRGRPVEVEWVDERARPANPPHRPPEGGPETHVLRGEAAQLVHTTLDLLSPRHSQVLEWKYLDNLPVNEIADRMSLTPKAAESLLTRARGSFRETYTRLQMGRSHEQE
jgi:RNA polymerase sigma-70 factor (ECF subfamily)